MSFVTTVCHCIPFFHPNKRRKQNNNENNNNTDDNEN